MKINEKNLISYSVSRDYIDKEGYLLKRGEINKSFQRRWFVLKGNLLFYFEKKSDKEPYGVIILEGCTTELGESDEHYVFKLMFNGKGARTYVFAAESQAFLESWMKAISRASYDYLKLMVAELQKQLEEIEAKENSEVGIVSPFSYSNSSSSFSKQRENPFNRNEDDCSYSDLWRTNESLQNATSLLSRSSSISSGGSASLFGGVNSSLPLSIPFRKAPSPPTFKNVITNKKTKSFEILHKEYGEPMLRDKMKSKELKLNIQSDNLVEKSKIQNLIDL